MTTTMAPTEVPKNLPMFVHFLFIYSGDSRFWPYPFFPDTSVVTMLMVNWDDNGDDDDDDYDDNYDDDDDDNYDDDDDDDDDDNSICI